LEYLKIWQGRKAIVMPCLIELGKASVEVHKRIGEKIGEICDLAIITTKDKFKEIKENAVQSGIKEKNILFLENPKQIVEKIKTFCRPEDVILLEGRIPKEVIDLLTK
jgi:UDP-N-acetylmuramyl pentapeptide synthase